MEIPWRIFSHVMLINKPAAGREEDRNMIKIAMTGACGRMGQRIAALAVEDSNIQIVGALERDDHPDLGKNYAALTGLSSLNVKLSSTLVDRPDVLIDFTIPASTAHWIEMCLGHKIPMVIGTTGLGDSELTLIKNAARTIPIVQAPNMSIGMNLLFRMVGEMAKILGDDYDIEIVEQHHRFKKDAPSGTALGLLDSIAKGIGKDPKKIAVFGREGKDVPRQPGQIGMHAVRLGDTVGEHVVYFGSLGETVSVAHSAHSRDTFARGALRAAAWIVGRTPNVYSMQDVLFGKKE